MKKFLLLACAAVASLAANAAVYHAHWVKIEAEPFGAGKVYFVPGTDSNQNDTPDESHYAASYEFAGAWGTNENMSYTHLYAIAEEGYELEAFYFDADGDEVFDPSWDEIVGETAESEILERWGNCGENPHPDPTLSPLTGVKHPVQDGGDYDGDNGEANAAEAAQELPYADAVYFAVFKQGGSGVESTKVAKANGASYNVAGQNVAADAKGIVIRDGKKYFNK